MSRTYFLKILCALASFVTPVIAAGCFPTLPPEEALEDARHDVGDRDSDENDAVDADGSSPPDTLPDLENGDVGDSDGETVLDANDSSGDMDGPDAEAPPDSLVDTADPTDLEQAPDADANTVVTCNSDEDCPASTPPCGAWACVEGACVESPANDGVGCDDGNLCTDNDACVAGVCIGAVRVCTPSGPCVTSAGCFEATGTCIEVPVVDGTACDDGDSCTTVDACVEGVCEGGSSPLPTHDLALAIGYPEGLRLYGALQRADRGLRLVARFDGSMGHLFGSAGDETVAGVRGIGFVDTSSSGNIQSVNGWAESLDEWSVGPFTASLGIHSVAAGGFTMGGHFNAPFTPAGDSRLIGEPLAETDFSSEGLFVTSLASDLTTRWIAAVHGPSQDGMGIGGSEEFRMNDLGRDFWRSNGAEAGLLAVHMGSPRKFALKDAAGGLHVVDATSRATDSLVVLWWLSESGVGRELGRLTASTGRFVVRDADVRDDGTIFVVGTAAGATMTFSSEAGTHSIPTSSGSPLYSWILAIGPGGDVLWSRSFRVPASGSPDNTYDVHVSAVAEFDGAVAVAVRALRNPVADGAGLVTTALVSDLGVAATLAGSWVVVTFDDSGGFEDRVLVEGERLAITGLDMDAHGVVLAGQTTSLVHGSVALTHEGQTPRPFVARLGQWAEWTLWQPTHDSTEDPPFDEADWFLPMPDPGLTLSPDGSVMSWIMGLTGGGDFEVGPDRSATLPEVPFMGAAAIVRLNTNNSLDCR